MLDKNDLQAIAELLKPINDRLDTINNHLDSIDERLSKVGKDSKAACGMVGSLSDERRSEWAMNQHRQNLELIRRAANLCARSGIQHPEQLGEIINIRQVYGFIGK